MLDPQRLRESQDEAIAVATPLKPLKTHGFPLGAMVYETVHFA